MDARRRPDQPALLIVPYEPGTLSDDERRRGLAFIARARAEREARARRRGIDGGPGEQGRLGGAARPGSDATAPDVPQ